MGLPNIDVTGIKPPSNDGDVQEYAYREAVASRAWNRDRKVIFVNGMGNSGADHVQSALALSWVQMCTVIGVFNRSTGFLGDVIQCVGDKNQFDGFSLGPRARVGIRRLVMGETSADAARAVLSRNRCQVALFDVVRANRGVQIFAHSQGNLILSNVLQAVKAVDGAGAITGLEVHTFGSPAVNWPAEVTMRQHGFTFDPVNWLSGFDSTWTISKMGWPSGTNNPFTHGFLWYMREDPTFLVNRFRTGGWGMTFNMDEKGLAEALVAMGRNTERVRAIFKHLESKHNSDSDDVAELYINAIRSRPMIVAAIKRDTALRDLLVRILSTGIQFPGEQRAISFLRAL